MTSSVFDRLSQQGTAASAAREAKEKEDREKQQQRRAAEKAAVRPKMDRAKLQQMHAPQDPKLPKVRSPKQKDSFYNRLSKQETASSAAHHKAETSGTPGLKSPKKANSEVFNRLYKQETAATKAHHLKEEPLPISPKKGKPTPPPSLLKRMEEAAKSPEKKPVPIEMKLHIRTKGDKKEGKPYSDLDLTQADVRRQINMFSSGKISDRALAFDIIGALFHRDFTPGPHWQIGTAILEDLDPLLDKTLLDGVEGEFKIYGAHKEAKYDWKESNQFARAEGNLLISKGDIYVDGYSYKVSG
ncbi:hypothetical protein ACHAXT_002897 [Thalassiosira profunda]